MPERYVDAIIKYLADRDYQPLKPRQLARQMGVAEEEYSSFREAIKVLRDSGRLVLGARNALVLPEMGRIVTGTFRANRRGFGFVVPDSPNAHGDLFIP
jgi:ribonuclease R